MKKILLLILLFANLLGANGQSLSVGHFVRLDNDFDARVNHPVRDPNGKVCALIKVENINTGFQFTTGTIDVVKTEAHSGETWVYVQPGVRKMTVSHPSFGILRDYAFPIAIEEATTYLLILRSPVEAQGAGADYKPQTGMVFFKSVPDGANVFINDERKGTTPYIEQFNLGETISWRFEKKLYENEEGELTVSAPQETVELELRHSKEYFEVKGKGFLNLSVSCGLDEDDSMGYLGVMGGYLGKVGCYGKALVAITGERNSFNKILTGGIIKSITNNIYVFGGVGYVDGYIGGCLCEGGAILRYKKLNLTLGYGVNASSSYLPGYLTFSLGYCF